MSAMSTEVIAARVRCGNRVIARRSWTAAVTCSPPIAPLKPIRLPRAYGSERGRLSVVVKKKEPVSFSPGIAPDTFSPRGMGGEYMARRRRLLAGGETYHVIQRGNDRMAIFFEDADRRPYLNWLAEAAAEASLYMPTF